MIAGILVLLLAFFSGQIYALMMAETVKRLWLLTISPDAPAFHVLYGAMVIFGFVLAVHLNGVAKEPVKDGDKDASMGYALTRIITTLLATGFSCLLVIGLTKLTTILFL